MFFTDESVKNFTDSVLESTEFSEFYLNIMKLTKFSVTQNLNYSSYKFQNLQVQVSEFFLNLLKSS